jgi:hypothetical protein
MPRLSVFPNRRTLVDHLGEHTSRRTIGQAGDAGDVSALELPAPERLLKQTPGLGLQRLAALDKGA